MRRVNFLGKIVFFLWLACAWSCAKEGSVGPVGDKGDKGDKGEKGEKGDDGTMLRFGNGVPSVSLGNEGDFYIDMKNNDLYGPKKGNSWGDAISLKGATGATGAAGKDGSRFLSGTVDPTNTIGKEGDFYFNKASGILFGPKGANGWSAGVMLKGGKGDKGDKGDKGEDGNANVLIMGWTKVPKQHWKNLWGYTSGSNPWLTFSSPGDKQLRVVEDVFSAHANLLTGAILVYANNGTGSRMLPFEDELNARGHKGTLAYRFVFRNNRIYMVVALRDGSWDIDYIMDSYLPSIQWKVVLIPASIAKTHSAGLSQLDFADDEAVSSYLNSMN